MHVPKDCEAAVRISSSRGVLSMFNSAKDFGCIKEMTLSNTTAPTALFFHNHCLPDSTLPGAIVEFGVVYNESGKMMAHEVKLVGLPLSPCTSAATSRVVR